MQKQQPRFSEDQRRELGAVHSWVRKGQLPRALDVTVREVWEARKRLGRKILSSSSRDRGLTSDVSAFGSLILKDANSIPSAGLCNIKPHHLMSFYKLHTTL